MILVKLPVFNSIEEDFLRYRFNSWGKNIKISLHHEIGQGIFAAIERSYDKPVLKADTQYVTLEVPDHNMFNLGRYPFFEISIQDALRIKMELMSAYYAEVNRVVNWGRRRGLNLKESITRFLDALDFISGDYELSINYEQIRKMITRDDRKLSEIMNEFNKLSIYKSTL